MKTEEEVRQEFNACIEQAKVAEEQNLDLTAEFWHERAVALRWVLEA